MVLPKPVWFNSWKNDSDSYGLILWISPKDSNQCQTWVISLNWSDVSLIHWIGTPSVSSCENEQHFNRKLTPPKKITVLFLNSLNILLCLNPNIYIKFYTSPCSAKLCHILYLKLLCTIHSYQIDGESETDRATCYVKWRVNVWKRKRSLIDKRMTWKRRQRGVLFKVPDQWTRQQNCYH